MSVHKVPQDVEADDKLIGPFSFKQFVFVLITFGFGWVAFMLFRVQPFMALIPMPFMLVFGILGLPLRKDQPTDVYVAALINFWMRPKKRLWGQEGMLEHVIINVPKKADVRYSDGLSRREVRSRLSSLARTIDSRGWASKNALSPYGVADSDRLVAPTYIVPARAVEDNKVDDMLDTESSELAQKFARLEAKQAEHQITAAPDEALELIEGAATGTPGSTYVPSGPAPEPEPEPTVQFAGPLGDPKYNPMPASIHQKVIKPMSDNDEPSNPPSTSPAKPADDILDDDEPRLDRDGAEDFDLSEGGELNLK